MRSTSLGPLLVSAQGLGCMSMSEHYGPTDWERSTAAVHRALDLGVSLLDTADIYGAGHNEGPAGRRSPPGARRSCSPMSFRRTPLGRRPPPPCARGTG